MHLMDEVGWLDKRFSVIRSMNIDISIFPTVVTKIGLVVEAIVGSGRRL